MTSIDNLIADSAVWVVSESLTGMLGLRHPPYCHESWWGGGKRTRATLAYALQGFKVKSRSRPHGVEV